jgi:hypothetical protein
MPWLAHTYVTSLGASYAATVPPAAAATASRV